MEPSALGPATGRAELQPGALRALANPNLGRTLASVGFDYAVIALAIACCLQTWWAYPFAAVLIASRQHSLLIFMHEAAHYSLSRRKWFNDLLGNLLCAWPMFLDVGAFRHVHLQHHRFEGKSGDPDFEFRSGADWQFPMPRTQLVRVLMRDLFGGGVADAIRQIRYYGTAPRERRAWMLALKTLFYCALAAMVMATNSGLVFVLCWLLPTVTLLKAFIRVREIAEHYGLPATHPLNRTRTTQATLVMGALIAPRNINYHLEHHLYPGIPWQNLPHLRKLLMRDPLYAAHGRSSESYLHALQECAQASESAAQRPTALDAA